MTSLALKRRRAWTDVDCLILQYGRWRVSSQGGTREKCGGRGTIRIISADCDDFAGILPVSFDVGTLRANKRLGSIQHVACNGCSF